MVSFRSVCVGEGMRVKYGEHVIGRLFPKQQKLCPKLTRIRAYLCVLIHNVKGLLELLNVCMCLPTKTQF